MLGHGLFNEVKALVEQGFESSQYASNWLQELVPVIKGEMELEPAIELLKQHSRQYAKRQLTWFKNKMNVQWFDRDNVTSNDVR